MVDQKEVAEQPSAEVIEEIQNVAGSNAQFTPGEAARLQFDWPCSSFEKCYRGGCLKAPLAAAASTSHNSTRTSARFGGLCTSRDRLGHSLSDGSGSCIHPRSHQQRCMLSISCQECDAHSSLL